jgi:hypothetical protein
VAVLVLAPGEQVLPVPILSEIELRTAADADQLEVAVAVVFTDDKPQLFGFTAAAPGFFQLKRLIEKGRRFDEHRA